MQHTYTHTAACAAFQLAATVVMDANLDILSGVIDAEATSLVEDGEATCTCATVVAVPEWTRTDEKVGGYTLRIDRQDGAFYRATVYDPSGWFVNQYKTEAGARRVIARNTEADVIHDHSHRAYAPDYCPLCGTARVIGGGN